MSTAALGTNINADKVLLKLVGDRSQTRWTQIATAVNLGHDLLSLSGAGWQAIGNTSGALTPNYTLGRYYAATLTGNVTSVTPTAGTIPGVELTLILTQDGTGSRTATGWTSAFTFAGGAAPTLSTTAGLVDTISFVWDGAKWREIYRCIAQPVV